MATFFLLQTNGSFLLQTNGGKIIVAETDEEGGGSGGKTKQVGVSLVKKQQILGNRPFETIVNHIKSKLVVFIEGIVTAPPPLRIPHMLHKMTSKLVLVESCVTVSKLYTKGMVSEARPLNLGWGNENTSKYVIAELCEMSSTLRIDQEAPMESLLIRVEMLEAYSPVPLIHPTSALMEYLKDSEQKKAISESKQDKKKRLISILKLLEAIPMKLEVIGTPVIQVDLASDKIQQGNLLRITTHVNQQVPELWMRILGKNGVIVQKAGLVKTNATGFQILVATQQLDTAIYTIQVSTTPKFVTAGIAQVEIEGKSPIPPVIALAPLGLLSPDNEDEIIKFVKYRTMLDSKVDAKCKPFEGRRFRLDNPNKPVIPQHWGCRCFYEVD